MGSKLRESLAKEKQRNLAAKFEISFLTAEQIVALGKHVEPYDGDAADEQRNAFIADNSWLKITIGGMSPDEVTYASEKVRDAVPEIYKNSNLEEHERVQAGSKFLRTRRDVFWPILVRNIQKAEELEEGKWVKVELPELREYLA